MKFRQLIDWRIFLACLATSFALAWAVEWLFGLNYWAAWGIVMVAWAGVGASTFFDEEKPPTASTDEKPSGSARG